MTVVADITVWCEAIGPGCTFTARITDGARGRFYGGSGDTALEAIAWCLHEYVARGLLGRAHSMARGADAQPGVLDG